MQPLCLRAFPRAIIHIDADAFFASCEQAVNPKLKGKPVVTGKERGIASAVSYEAKALGIKRGMTIREIKAICLKVIHLPSDYETYSLFSQRMFSIVRRYTRWWKSIVSTNVLPSSRACGGRCACRMRRWPCALKTTSNVSWG